MMAKKLESQTTLTQFAPLSPESKTQTFSFKNIFWRTKEKTSAIETKLPGEIQNVQSESSTSTECLFTPSKPGFASGIESPTAEKYRGMSGILGKIMDNIVDKKKKGRLQSYKDSDFKQYWMPDSNCRECYECGERFTTFRRRHHCRVCGQIFCWRCCSQEIPGELIGYTDDLRVCSYCCKTVLSCVQSLDCNSNEDSPVPSTNFQEQQRDTNLEVPAPARRKSSVMGFREEDIARAKSFKSTLSNITYREKTRKFDGPIQDKEQLRNLMRELAHSVRSVSLWQQEYTDHQTQVMLGGDIVDYLVESSHSLTRLEAVNTGQALIDAQFLECIIPQQNFMDGNVFYKPLEQFEKNCQSERKSEIQESVEPLWVKEIQSDNSNLFKETVKEESQIAGNFTRLSSSSSKFYLDLDIKESRVSIYKSQSEADTSPSIEDPVSSSSSDVKQDNAVLLNSKVLEGVIQEDTKVSTSDNSSTMKSLFTSRTWHHSHLREDNGEKSAFENLNASYKQHEATLLKQLLSNGSLSMSWTDIILPIVHHVVDAVRPDVKNDADDMDIRQYVQFKKIPGGNKSECSIVSGVVFSKTVAHKKMRHKILKPTILLLSSSISYQRVENKLSSLDPILMQESEYLKNTIGKLTVFQPDILLVEKTVSRVAQEMLLELGVTVALNVKPPVMERIARCTQAAIVSTVDTHLGRPQLGTCDKFKVNTYSILGGKYKTLMFFDGCPENLGCTILLRGGAAAELKKVKHIVLFMLYVAYNWNLERSFLMDEFAMLPSGSESMDETSEGNNNPEVTAMEIDVASEDINSINAQCIPKKSKSKFEEYGKKMETESISDFSDPLHSYLQLENDVFHPDNGDLKEDPLPPTNTFRKLIDDVILCSSMTIKPLLPFLETDTGKKCDLRKYFPQEIYWSCHFTKENEVKPLHQVDTQSEMDEENLLWKKSKNVEVQPPHSFISYKITDVTKSSLETQALISDFRARGGTIRYLCPHEKAAKEKEKKSMKEHLKVTEVNQDNEICWEKKVDALDPCNHQTLAVLFSSYSCASDNAPNYCVNPWVVKMEFYGSNDITLGGFLDRYCFRSTYVCPSNTCLTPMTEHVRKFVHGNGCVHILLHELIHSCPGVPLSPTNILMWSWCHSCKKATPVVSMSEATWSLSFAKYLELRFYAKDVIRRGPPCTHSLHHDHYQYFAHNQLVAIFKYTPVLMWEVLFPAFMISVSDRALSVTNLVEQIRKIAVIGHGVNSDLLTALFALQEEYCETNSEDIVDDMINMLKLETVPFREKIEEVQLQLTSPTLESLKITSPENIEYNKDVCNYMWKIGDQIVLLKFHIANVVYTWNTRIQEFISARKKEQKSHSKLVSQSSRMSEEESVTKNNGLSDDRILPTMNVPDTKLNDTKKCELTPSVFHISKSKNIQKYVETFCKNRYKKFSARRSLSYGNLKHSEYSSEVFGMKRAKSEPDYLMCPHLEEVNNVFFTREQSLSSADSFYPYGLTPGICAGLRVSEIEDYDSYVVCHKDSIDDSTSIPSPKRHSRSKSETEAASSHGSQVSKITPEKQTIIDSGKSEKKERTVKNLLNQFLTSSTFTPITNPFVSLEHLLLPVSQKIPVIVHEEEPSSIIAYTLSLDDYEQKLQDLKLSGLSTNQKVPLDSLTSSPALKHRKLQDVSHLSSDDTFDFCVESLDSKPQKQTSTNRASSGGSSLHIEVQFSDNSTRFYCRVYYAEQFRKLRSVIFPEGEERYIRSLAHCVPWVARGGKSGSLFCKTHDDRFILKQMPKMELQSFMDLAPSYFQYLNKSYLEQKPTLLAKIVGIYRIGFKNTNNATKMDLLVMENLFYGRKVTRKYDLKGSVRNRLVNTSADDADIVLLDENLLKITCDNPFYVRPHSKTVLTLAINNDTQFLLEQSVMDYSLLVGLEENSNQLVVGIIDYIRTFTWDKKVEMLIKSSGILGGAGKMPTVVSPELYRMRFQEAMDSYFLWVPDRWTGLGSGVDG